MNSSRFSIVSLLILTLTLPSLCPALPTYTTLFSYPFTGEPGAGVNSKPLEGSDGALYGTTARIFNSAPNRPDGLGLIYRINKNGTGYTVLHEFDPAETYGPRPHALIETSEGELWGTTGRRGFATIFKMNLDGSGFRTLRTFTSSPMGALLEASDGLIYGALGGTDTIYGEGGDDPGLLYKINKDGRGLTVIHRFSWTAPMSDGWAPTGALIEDSEGVLYGTTRHGGPLDKGTIFRLNKDGSGFVTLYRFTGGDDGEVPHAGVIEGNDGALYGTTGGIGFNGHGSVYRINKHGSGFRVLRSFEETTAGAGLVLKDVIEGSDGALYVSGTEGAVRPSPPLAPTTSSIGPSIPGRSLLFKIGKDGSGYAVLHNFQSEHYNSDPLGVVEGADGMLSGTTAQGGYGGGTVFTISKSGTDYAVLRTFDGYGIRGIFPGGLVYGNDHVLYGASGHGGAHTVGALYKINTNGAGFSVIYNFTGGDDGAFPHLYFHGSDGLLYGTSYGGKLFRVNTDGGDFQVLHQLDATNGNTFAGLIEGPDGVLYGGTRGVFVPRPAPSTVGDWFATLFKMNKDGSGYETIYSFPYAGEGNFNFVLGSDGYIYVARIGGCCGAGFELLRFNPGGTSFESVFPRDFRQAGSSFFEGSDGALYSTWFSRSIARIEKNSSNVTIVHNFTPETWGHLAPRIHQGPDGFIYGSTSPTIPGRGIFFRLAKDGSSYNELFSFPLTTAGIALLVLVKGAAADFYGVTTAGGTDDFGSIYRVDVPIWAPVLTAASTWSSEVMLSWSSEDARVSAFSIERKTNGGEFAEIAVVGKDVREFQDTNATALTTYVYVIRATDGAAYSDYSNAAEVTTPGQEYFVSLVSVGVCDGFVAEANKRSNLGSSVFPSSAGPAGIRAGDTSLNQQVKGILSFRTRQLPDDATVLSARLMLKRGVMYGNPLTVLGRCVVDIKSGTGFGASPLLQPMDFQSLPGKARAGVLTPVGDDTGWYLAQLGPKSFTHIDKQANTQFRIYFETADNGDLAPDYIGWYSGECAIPENRPVLEIIYR
jgi:uncharacterized repeat protein (TIGR03803 family)